MSSEQIFYKTLGRGRRFDFGKYPVIASEPNNSAHISNCGNGRIYAEPLLHKRRCTSHSTACGNSVKTLSESVYGTDRLLVKKFQRIHTVFKTLRKTAAVFADKTVFDRCDSPAAFNYLICYNGKAVNILPTSLFPAAAVKKHTTWNFFVVFCTRNKQIKVQVAIVCFAIDYIFYFFIIQHNITFYILQYFL